VGIEADLFVTCARVWSDGAVVPGADALIAGSGRILAVGMEGELAPLAGRSAIRLDARGATVTPGLCDAHVHLLRWAHAFAALDLRNAGGRDDAVAMVRGFVRRNPGADVVVGRGWDDSRWSAPAERGALDAACGDRPVLLWAHDDHTLWVNSAALREAGVDASTPDPDGGRFERDRSGAPTGIVREHATRVFAAIEKRAPRQDDREALAQAVPRLHAMGVTAVHDFENAQAFRAIAGWTRSAGPRVRVLAHLAHGGLEEALALGLQSGVGDDTFRIGGVKLFADGTLGSRTAALLAPYDGTSETGMDLIPPAELRRIVVRAAEGGITCAIHAIGDRACRSCLDAIESAGASITALALPPRIEHVQLLDPADRGRFAALGVVASMQPSHCVSDIDLAARYWHSRGGNTYPWQTLLRSGARLVFGSDAPIEPPDPSLGLHAALTRQRPDGTPEGGYTPGERIGLDEALAAYTEGPARLSGAWPRLGRLARGAWADLVIWDRDLHAESPGRIHEARPAVTVFEGTPVHGPGAVSTLRDEARQGAVAAAGTR
jgi:predicted amidohydrolase YtcJ